MIRNMVKADFDEVNTLMKEVHAIHVKNRPDLYIEVEEPYPRNEFEKDVCAKNKVCILAEDEGKIQGICFVSITEKNCLYGKPMCW